MQTSVLLERGPRARESLIIASSIQDVEPILELNARERGAARRGGWGRHVARIPNVILVKWLDEEHARGNAGLRLFTREFDALIARKLADPEWAYLKTS